MKDNGHYQLRADLQRNKHMKDSEKIILSIVDSYSNKLGYCWLQNLQIVELSAYSLHTVETALTALRKYGLLATSTDRRHRTMMTTRRISPENYRARLQELDQGKEPDYKLSFHYDKKNPPKLFKNGKISHF